MANNPSTIKRIRQNVHRRDRNRVRRSTLRNAIKQLRVAVAEGNRELATTKLGQATSLLDRAAQAGVIHHNAADRSKSRLARLVRGMETAAA